MPIGSHEAELFSFIEGYESAQARAGHADLADHLPPRQHPLYREVLLELVRVDLEYGWEHGRAQPLEEYRRRFPELFCDPLALHDIAFEEYRLRRQAGEEPLPTDYQHLGIDTSHWPQGQPCDHAQPDALSGLSLELYRSDPLLAEEVACAAAALPEAGADFLGFRLIAVLGQGAFARVFLAQEGKLANRFVALKVTAALFNESQQLAQLQHTNIVPIYSVHQSGPLMAVCMPYLGATTLADVLKHLPERGAMPNSGAVLVAAMRARRPPQGLPDAAGIRPPNAFIQRLETCTFVEAVLELALRLAEGLIHAHERGIVHHDIKPANILLADDGQPLLLDFNLSADTKVNSSLPSARLGGTLPYMAPEHLEAFSGERRSLDARSDLYALGIILYEVLTGRHPFPLPQGGLPQVAARLLAERGQPVPCPRTWNPAICPAVASIVGHCLEADMGRRYQSASELADDLRRHLANQPLRHAAEPSLRERGRKWLRRHPRLTSVAGVATCATLFLLALSALFIALSQRLAKLEAIASFNQSRDEIKTAQYLVLGHQPFERGKWQEGQLLCQRLLERYEVLTTPSWQSEPRVRLLPPNERSRLVQEMGELLLLCARVSVTRADTRDGGSQGLEAALRLNQLAEACYADGQMPRVIFRQRQELLTRLGRHNEARQAADDELTVVSSGSARDRCLLAADEVIQGRIAEALALLREAARQEPDNFRIWLDLAICHERLGHDAQSTACFSTCIALWPRFPPLYYKRGCAYLRAGDPAQARADLDVALRLHEEHGGAFSTLDLAELYLQRARALVALDEAPTALADLDRSLAIPDGPASAYFLRARLHDRLGNRAQARRDRDAGLQRQPGDEMGWVDRGLERSADDPRAAIADFDEALRLNPRSRFALQTKAQVLAEQLGQTEDALQVLNRLVDLYPDAVAARAGRGVLHARLGRRGPALQDAVACLRLEPTPRTRYQVARIYALTARLHAADAHEAILLLSAAVHAGFGRELLQQDKDLDALRQLPEFRQLLKQAEALGVKKGT